MNTSEIIPPAAGEAVHTPTPMRCTFDPASGDDCGYISIWRNDDTPTASLVSRLADTPHNREVAAFIVRACNDNAHLLEAQKLLEWAVNTGLLTGLTGEQLDIVNAHARNLSRT